MVGRMTPEQRTIEERWAGMAPQRIQRKRTKGWRMPENTVYVGRPSRWRNPFKIGDHVSGHGIMKNNADCVKVFREWLNLQCSGAYGTRPDMAEEMKDYMVRIRGKNLACWCPLDQPCHADVLLEIANKGGEK